MKKLTTIILTILFLTALTLTLPQTVTAQPFIYIKPDGLILPPGSPIYSLDNQTFTQVANIQTTIIIEQSNILYQGNNYTNTGIVLSSITETNITNIRIIEGGLYFKNTNLSALINSFFWGHEQLPFLFRNSNNNQITSNNFTFIQQPTFEISSNNQFLNNTFNGYRYTDFLESYNTWTSNYWFGVNGNELTNGEPYILDQNNIDNTPQIPLPIPTPSPIPSATPSPTISPSPTASPSPTPTISPSPTPNITPSPSPTISPEPTSTPTITPTPNNEPITDNTPLIAGTIVTSATAITAGVYYVKKRKENKQ